MAPKVAAGIAGPNGVVKKKRVVTTAADRERAKNKAADARYEAAKTDEARAWINPAKLLNEFFSRNREDVLALKIGAGIRRDICARGEALGLHVQMFDTQSRKNGPLDSWIVLGLLSSRHLVDDKVRDIQRQSKRELQRAEDEAEDEDEVGADAEEPKNPAELIDPSLREQRAPMAQMMLPPLRQATAKPKDVVLNLPDQTSKATETTQMDLPSEDIEAAKQLSDLKSSAMPARPVFRPETSQVEATRPSESPVVSDTLPQDITAEQSLAEDTTENDRIASWVSQQAQPGHTEKDTLDLTGTWKITCTAIAEQLGSSPSDLTMKIRLEPTQPQTDNDTDDDPTITSAPSDQLTDTQKARLGTYQLWATFNFGLYHGLIRFLAPTTPNTSPLTRSSFDLSPTQLPSTKNLTFQYKWRGRETSDEEISLEAEKTIQWVKFEESGVKLTGVFESEYLGETGFEGQKVGKEEGEKEELGRLWSQVSPQAHEAEVKQKE
ncbi:hypothetical protein E4T39_04772 [Aureobasidium subglaciale]|nr:hypothetical protein E4T39_04772 [Aureobasidium subglaciale]